MKKTGVAALLVFLVFTATATAAPYLSLSQARQAITRTVAGWETKLDSDGNSTTDWNVGACWRISSSRVNCHVSITSYIVTGTTMHCAWTVTAWTDARWLHIRKSQASCT